jgi:hypothetical protein
MQKNTNVEVRIVPQLIEEDMRDCRIAVRIIRDFIRAKLRVVEALAS